MISRRTARTSGGGEGEPVFVEREFFAAIEHPAGVNEGKERADSVVALSRKTAGGWRNVSTATLDS